MVRRKPTRHRLLVGALSWASPAQLLVTCVTLTLVCALLVVSRRHSFSPEPEQGLQKNVGTHGGAATLGHQVQFLQSHQNLKDSNLLEHSLEDTERIFQGAAVPDRVGQDSEFNLKKNGHGFLSNVAEAQRGVSGVSITAAPAVASKPLGFYFSKDIPGHVKEKALGTRSSNDPTKAVDGKAAMNFYFNKDRPLTERQHVDSALEVQSEQIIARGATAQQISTDEQQSVHQREDGLAGALSDSQHRKVLRGINKGIQTGKALHAGQNVSAGKLFKVDSAVKSSSDPLSVALNFSSVKTDDM